MNFKKKLKNALRKVRKECSQDGCDDVVAVAVVVVDQLYGVRVVMFIISVVLKS